MHVISKRLVLLVFVLCLLFISQALAQQNLPFIRVSPTAKISQGIGFANVEINYNRPGVKEREVYGKLVPYGLAPNPFGNGKPMPWRAGANENTTITLSHDAKVNGKELAAGTYSLHMIVNEGDWTLIFNGDTQAWGSFFYEENNDVLRITAKPSDTEHREWLTYGFENLSLGSCDVYMHWEKKKVAFNIEFDRHAIVLDTYRTQLTTLPGFNQAAWGAAARYCLQNNINQEEAMSWVDKALGMNGGNTFANKRVKAGLLTAKGMSSEGDNLMAEAIETANENELNTYGYQLMGQNRMDDAIKIFELNIERHPQSWNCYDSLAEALGNKGDSAGSKKYYLKALEMAPEDQKARLEGILKNL